MYLYTSIDTPYTHAQRKHAHTITRSAWFVRQLSHHHCFQPSFVPFPKRRCPGVVVHKIARRARARVSVYAVYENIFWQKPVLRAFDFGTHVFARILYCLYYYLCIFFTNLGISFILTFWKLKKYFSHFEWNKTNRNSFLHIQLKIFRLTFFVKHIFD